MLAYIRWIGTAMKPTDPIARFVDLQKQGFMRPRKERKPKVVEIVACDRCRDWHAKGKHTVTQP
jgi:hypothetical protein